MLRFVNLVYYRLKWREVRSKQRETTSTCPPGLFPRYDMDSAIRIQDNGVKGASSIMLGKSRSAENVAIQLRLSSSEILATGNIRVLVKVACLDVRTLLLELRTMLWGRKLENVNLEIKSGCRRSLHHQFIIIGLPRWVCIQYCQRITSSVISSCSDTSVSIQQGYDNAWRHLQSYCIYRYDTIGLRYAN